MNLTLLLTGLLGGWLAADATAFAQLLVSQPLIGGWLAGALWGDPKSGLTVGALLQLYALSGLPLGGRTPDDYASAGVVGASVAVSVHRLLPLSGFSTALVLGAVAGWTAAVSGRPLVRWLRERNEGLTRWAEAEILAGHPAALDRAHWLGVAHAFAVGAGFTVVALTVLVAVAHAAVSYDSIAFARASSAAEPVLWGVGAGLATRQMVAFRRGTGILFLAAVALWVALRWRLAG